MYLRSGHFLYKVPEGSAYNFLALLLATVLAALTYTKLPGVLAETFLPAAVRHGIVLLSTISAFVATILLKRIWLPIMIAVTVCVLVFQILAAMYQSLSDSDPKNEDASAAVNAR